MKKFLILFHSSQSAGAQMAQATPEQMQAGMQAWISWKDEAMKIARFEFGMPLESVGRVGTDGITTSDTTVSGYAMMEGESKEIVMNLLKNHPHLQRPDASIDVLEMLHMPGLE